MALLGSPEQSAITGVSRHMTYWEVWKNVLILVVYETLSSAMQTWGKSLIRCGIVAIRYGPCSNICHETLELHKSQAACGVCTVVENSEQRGRLQPCGLVSPPSLCFIKMRSFTKPGRKKGGECEWVRVRGGGKMKPKWVTESKIQWKQQDRDKRKKRKSFLDDYTSMAQFCVVAREPTGSDGKMSQDRQHDSGTVWSPAHPQTGALVLHTHPHRANTASHVWFITVQFINTDS